MSDLDRLLSEFVDAWNAGQRPSARGYLDLVDDDGQRSELAGQITAFLDVATIPSYPSGALDDARTGEVVEAAAAAFETDASGWSTLLPRWRAAAGLTLDQLATRILESAGLRGADREKATGYLTSMERGGLDAGRMTQRAMKAVAQALGIDPGDFVRAGQPAHAMAADPLFRAVDDAHNLREQLAALTDALVAPGEPDAVDGFFVGVE